jgi:hypothetical protein
MTDSVPLSAGTLLYDFAVSERERFDARDADILATYTRQLAELVRYLEITADEYEAANRAFLAIAERRFAWVQESAERAGARRALTAEDRELFGGTEAASLLLYLRIDTFYVFAKILLDKLAGLISHYFGPGPGRSRRRRRMRRNGSPCRTPRRRSTSSTTRRISDRTWTAESRLKGEKRDAFIHRILGFPKTP